MSEKIKFIIPKKHENLTIIRLTTSAVANKISFSIEKIEDLKVCVSEVCNMLFQNGDGEDFEIDYEISEKSLKISFKDGTITEYIDKYEINLMILEALLDSLDFRGDNITLELNV